MAANKKSEVSGWVVKGIAIALGVASTAIKRIERWAKVWFVVVSGKGGRFVSLEVKEAPRPNAKDVYQRIKEALGLKACAKKFQTARWVIVEVYRLCNLPGQALPREYGQIAYGIQYAIQTGRVDSLIATTLEREYTASMMVALIAAIAASGVEVSGDVPQWLNSNHDVVIVAF